MAAQTIAEGQTQRKREKRKTRSAHRREIAHCPQLKTPQTVGRGIVGNEGKHRRKEKRDHHTGDQQRHTATRAAGEQYNHRQHAQRSAQSGEHAEPLADERREPRLPHRDDQAPQQGADRCSHRCPGMDTEERRIGQGIFEERLRDESTNAQPSADKQRCEQTGEPEIRHDDPRAFCRFPTQESRHDIANRNGDTAAAQSHEKECRHKSEQAQRQNRSACSKHVEK